MKKTYSDISILFTLANTQFQILNMVYEEFHRTIPSHVHGSGSYEIHYIHTGYGRALINGASYSITPGTLYITGPHVGHAQSPLPENPMAEYCIYLKTSAKRRASSAGIPDGESEILQIFENTPFWFGQAPASIASIIPELFQEAAEHKKGWQLQIASLLKQLLVCITRAYEKESPDSSTASLSLSDKAAIIIEDYFLYQYQNLSLDELAQNLGLGTRQTERLLLKHYGKTFLQKKTEAKMSAAASLLSDTTQSITAIAETLGYSSIEHFSSAFKKYYQISPRQYRKDRTQD